jgi:hypothetical protein
MMAVMQAKDDDARFYSWRIGRWMAEMTAWKGCGCLMELSLTDFQLRNRMAFFGGGVNSKMSGEGRLTFLRMNFRSRAGAPFQGHDLEVCEPSRTAWPRFGAHFGQRRVLQDACRARCGCAACLCGLQPAARALRCGRGAARLSPRGRCGGTRQRLWVPSASGLSMGPVCTWRIVRRTVLVLPPNERPGACASVQAHLAAPPLALPLPRPGQARWNGLTADPAPLDLLACNRTDAPPCALGDSGVCRWAACAVRTRSQLYLFGAAKRF